MHGVDNRHEEEASSQQRIRGIGVRRNWRRRSSPGSEERPRARERGTHRRWFSRAGLAVPFVDARAVAVAELPRRRQWWFGVVPSGRHARARGPGWPEKGGSRCIRLRRGQMRGEQISPVNARFGRVVGVVSTPVEAGFWFQAGNYGRRAAC
ncbi:formin-like protein 3 isoform X2 [Iris pallida]|uniref:Formin-like protein 3 isoform X2 n=1 Tax=Iris pallida TaxID=29817 RepID=A0AAX6FI71_IRIPA|nr:formin-like protein 3 isoform X2 [Iris pallida]KAJ6852542.1 formin-like protein 3 isoform X2 [Iris pallida]